MTGLHLQALGGLRLRGPEGELLAGRKKELALLVYVARRAPKPVPREELIALLWGDRPEANARQSLRQALLHLKQAANGVIIVEPEQVLLAPEGVELDVTAFEVDLAAGRLEQAVERWAGDFLSGAEDAGGEAYRLWVETEREALRKRLSLAFERLLGTERGAPDRVLRWAGRWAELMPLDERPQAALIEELARAGHQDEALARHAAFLMRLRHELELEPSPGLLRLGREIERQTRARAAPRLRPGSTVLFTPDLVGRHAPLDQLEAAWQVARAGTATVVLVEGEEGIGKTRLCEEFLRLVGERTDPAVILRARAHEPTREAPGSLLRELLGELREAPGLLGSPAGALAALAALVPGIRERLRLAEIPTAWPAVEATAQVLRDVATELPILVFLDDFPAADRATQDLLLAVAERLRKARVLMLLTARSADVASCPAWIAARNAYGVGTIRLQALDVLSVEPLVASMLQMRTDERRALAERLHQESGGNPFYAIQLVAALLDERHLLPDPDGTWRPVAASLQAPVPAPASLRDAIGRRLHQLAEPARRLVEVAAVLAQPADTALLAEVADSPTADLEPVLEELLATRFLQLSSSPSAGYEFPHEVTRRVVYQSIPEARRQALHQRALAVLQAAAGDDEHVRAAAQYHRARAGSGLWPRAATVLKAMAGQGDPLRVAALFGVSAGLVLALVFALLIQLGLPDWVLTAAVALLAIGLPIMVATGLAERRRARASATDQPTATGPARHLTWRNALLGGGLAFGVLALVTAGYTAMRLLGIGPLGTLVATGVLDPRDPLVLADFVNRTGDSTLGPSVTEALRVDLTQSRTVRLLDRATIADALQRMERPAGTALDLRTAQELAQREGVQAVVSGEIGPVGEGYVLSARLLATEERRELAAVRATAPNDAALIAAVDRLSSKLRERIGESLKSIRVTPPLIRVTTASLPALRQYTEGYRALTAGETEQALGRFEQATAIDTTFASAYRAIAVILSNSRGEQSRIRAASTRAFRHRDRLPDIERHLATAWYYTMVEPSIDSNIAAYTAILEIDPTHNVALINLSSVSGGVREYARAEGYARRSLENAGVAAPAPSYYNLADALVGQGRLAAAESVISLFAARQPTAPQPVWFRGLLAAARQDFTTARAVFDTVAQRYGTSRLWRARAEDPLAMLDELEGRLGSAERRLNGLMELSARDQAGRDYLLTALKLGWLDLRYRARPATTLRRLNAALERFPLSSLPPEDRPLLELAEFNAAAGRPDRARQLLAEWEATTSPPIRNDDTRRHAVAGAIALAEGRHRDAVVAYRAQTAAVEVWTGEWCNPCGLFELARAYDLAGEPDSAVAAYERALTTVNLPWFYGGAGHQLAYAYRRLGNLYEQRGQHDRAAEHYRRFIELWKDADPELQPAVREVRR